MSTATQENGTTRHPEPLSDDDRLKRLAEIASGIAAMRRTLVAEVCAAFNQGISAHRIGRALGITEAGARMIRKRRK